MADKLATWGDLNSIAGSTLSADVNRYPSYSEAIATGKITVVGSYSGNQLVALAHCSKTQMLIYNRPYDSSYIYSGGGTQRDTYMLQVAFSYSVATRLTITGFYADPTNDKPRGSFSIQVPVGATSYQIGAYQESVPGNGLAVYIDSVSPSSDSTYIYM